MGDQGIEKGLEELLSAGSVFEFDGAEGMDGVVA